MHCPLALEAYRNDPGWKNYQTLGRRQVERNLQISCEDEERIARKLESVAAGLERSLLQAQAGVLRPLPGATPAPAKSSPEESAAPTPSTAAEKIFTELPTSPVFELFPKGNTLGWKGTFPSLENADNKTVRRLKAQLKTKNVPVKEIHEGDELHNALLHHGVSMESLPSDWSFVSKQELENRAESKKKLEAENKAAKKATLSASGGKNGGVEPETSHSEAQVAEDGVNGDDTNMENGE